jgi:hypothetical protein
VTEDELQYIEQRYDLDVFRSHGAETVHHLVGEVRRLQAGLQDVRLNIARGPLWIQERVQELLAEKDAP